MMRFLSVLLTCALLLVSSDLVSAVAHWPQGTGPTANFALPAEDAPTSWSVVRDQNIRWRKRLPETGQSTVVVWKDKLFFTTMEEVEQDSTLGQNIVAWCCDAATGKTVWTRKIAGKYPLRLSGCFSDSSAPPPVTDGQHVCFFNASGTIACFDMAGEPLWSKPWMTVGRSQPFLVGENVVFIKQSYMPENGKFSHAHASAPQSEWTQLQALNLKTGEAAWTSKCGIGMGNVPLPHRLKSGRQVILVGRGGGHSPPERPEGISMIDAENGETIWTLPLTGFMSTMTLSMHDSKVLVFHGPEHLWVDSSSGEIERRVSILDQISLTKWDGKAYQNETTTLPGAKSKRCIIQSSNLLVGDYHYFRSYTLPYLGRVNVQTAEVEYLQLPTQLKREADNDVDLLMWNPNRQAKVASDERPQTPKPSKRAEKKSPKSIPITQWHFAPNDMRNSRGYVVCGDKRSRGSGWGHYSSAVPTAVGKNLYVPTMNGTVYVIDHAAKVLDDSAILAINDLGPLGGAWNRASISYAGGALYAHTIKEVICIGE